MAAKRALISSVVKRPVRAAVSTSWIGSAVGEMLVGVVFLISGAGLVLGWLVFVFTASAYERAATALPTGLPMGGEKRLDYYVQIIGPV